VTELRITPEDEDGLGVFFVDEAGTSIPVELISQNDPKKLMILTPDLTPGIYTLQVITRFTSGRVFLKEPRVIVYDMPLIVS
jgi:hypothetical protein